MFGGSDWGLGLILIDIGGSDWGLGVERLVLGNG